MSANSKRESQSPASSHAFNGEDLESVEALGMEDESTKSKDLVERFIVEQGKVGEEGQSVSYEGMSIERCRGTTLPWRLLPTKFWV